jgi:hypothetical protein
LDFTTALPLASDEPLVAALAGADFSVVCCLLSGAVGAVCPVLSGVLIWSDFTAGAIVFAGAVCCAAGVMGVSSVLVACAETTPALSINIAAVVDISRKVLMDVSCGHSAICLILGMCGETTPFWPRSFQTVNNKRRLSKTAHSPDDVTTRIGECDFRYGVKNGGSLRRAPSPLYPQQTTFDCTAISVAKGQQQTNGGTTERRVTLTTQRRSVYLQ